MSSQFRLAVTVTAILAVCGPALAQELAPPGSEVSVHKLAIDSGFAHTVKYYVKGGRRGCRPWSAASSGRKTS
jgi:hypothetical protein